MNNTTTKTATMMSILIQCIVSPQLWMGISCIQMGSLTIYVAQSSTIYGILALICHYCLCLNVCFCLICFLPSQPPMDHIISSFPQVWPSSTHLRTLAQFMVPIIRERRCETRCHLETIGVPLVETVLKHDSVYCRVPAPGEYGLSICIWVAWRIGENKRVWLWIISICVGACISGSTSQSYLGLSSRILEASSQ